MLSPWHEKSLLANCRSMIKPSKARADVGSNLLTCTELRMALLTGGPGVSPTAGLVTSLEPGSQVRSCASVTAEGARNIFDLSMVRSGRGGLKEDQTFVENSGQSIRFEAPAQQSRLLALQCCYSFVSGW